jgi:hypothetical protein
MRSSALAFAALAASLAGCSGGSYPGTSGQGGDGTGTGTSTPAPSGSGDSSSNTGSGGSSGARGPASPATSSSPAPSSSAPPEDPPTTPPDSSGPRPECVAFANHQCACNGSHATATCNTDLANGCESGVQLCASQLTWYTCVTGNACGTSACTQPSGC